MEQIKKYWFIFYTCPRVEKNVYEYLQSLNYELFNL